MPAISSFIAVLFIVTILYFKNIIIIQFLLKRTKIVSEIIC